jgi:hypothetical protein
MISSPNPLWRKGRRSAGLLWWRTYDAHGRYLVSGGPSSRAKFLEVVAKAFEAGNLAYLVADAISWATEEGWKGI